MPVLQGIYNMSPDFPSENDTASIILCVSLAGNTVDPRLPTTSSGPSSPAMNTSALSSVPDALPSTSVAEDAVTVTSVPARAADTALAISFAAATASALPFSNSAT
ncbi:MAG: hypothetical protein LUH40_02445 [Clostridiales bacterium]|nr:hypothetical protein [Clostridiales bacterium]